MDIDNGSPPCIVCSIGTDDLFDNMGIRRIMGYRDHFVCCRNDFLYSFYFIRKKNKINKESKEIFKK